MWDARPKWKQDELPAEEKLAFFRETRHTFGRTALLLSGGGGLGTFHIGVVKALFEARLLPRVLAGSSVGSIGGWQRSGGVKGVAFLTCEDGHPWAPSASQRVVAWDMGHEEAAAAAAAAPRGVSGGSYRTRHVLRSGNGHVARRAQRRGPAHVDFLCALHFGPARRQSLRPLPHSASHPALPAAAPPFKLNTRLHSTLTAPPSACCPPLLPAAVCGIIGSRTDAELRDLFGRLDTFDVGFFSNSRAVELVQHLINKGSLQVGGGRGEKFLLVCHGEGGVQGWIACVCGGMGAGLDARGQVRQQPWQQDVEWKVCMS